MARQARNPNVQQAPGSASQIRQVDIDAITSLANAGMVDLGAIGDRVRRGESLNSAVDGSFTGRLTGDYERFIKDWEKLPDTVAAFTELVINDPGEIAKGLIMSPVTGVKGILGAGEQPIQAVSDALFLATLALGATSTIAGSVGGRTLTAAARTGSATQVATASVRGTSRLAQALRTPTATGLLLTGDVLSTVTDPEDPFGMFMLIPGNIGHFMNVARHRRGLPPLSEVREDVLALPPPKVTGFDVGPPSQQTRLRAKSLLARAESTRIGGPLDTQYIDNFVIRSISDTLDSIENRRVTNKVANESLDVLSNRLDTVREMITRTGDVRDIRGDIIPPEPLQLTGGTIRPDATQLELNIPLTQAEGFALDGVGITRDVIDSGNVSKVELSTFANEILDIPNEIVNRLDIAGKLQENADNIIARSEGAVLLEPTTIRDLPPESILVREEPLIAEIEPEVPTRTLNNLDQVVAQLEDANGKVVTVPGTVRINDQGHVAVNYFNPKTGRNVTPPISDRWQLRDPSDIIVTPANPGEKITPTGRVSDNEFDLLQRTSDVIEVTPKQEAFIRDVNTSLGDQGGAKVMIQDINGRSVDTTVLGDDTGSFVFDSTGRVNGRDMKFDDIVKITDENGKVLWDKGTSKAAGLIEKHQVGIDPSSPNKTLSEVSETSTRLSDLDSALDFNEQASINGELTQGDVDFLFIRIKNEGNIYDFTSRQIDDRLARLDSLEVRQDVPSADIETFISSHSFTISHNQETGKFQVLDQDGDIIGGAVFDTREEAARIAEDLQRNLEDTQSFEMKEIQLETTYPEGPFKATDMEYTGRDSKVLQGRVMLGDNVAPEFKSIANEWVDLVGIEGRIFIFDEADLLDPGVFKKYNMYGAYRGFDELRGNEQLKGIMMCIGTDYGIRMRDTTFSPTSLEVLAHEVGHIVEAQHFTNAPFEVQQTLINAHNRWSKETKGKDFAEVIQSVWPYHNTTKFLKSLEAGTKIKNHVEMLAYQKSFSEWLANNVARWLTTNRVPVGRINLFFKGIADVIRRLVENVTDRSLRVDPNPTVSGFLDIVSGQKTTSAKVFQGTVNRYVASHGEGLNGTAVRDTILEVNRRAMYGVNREFAEGKSATYIRAMADPTVTHTKSEGWLANWYRNAIFVMKDWPKKGNLTAQGMKNEAQSSTGFFNSLGEAGKPSAEVTKRINNKTAILGGMLIAPFFKWEKKYNKFVNKRARELRVIPREAQRQLDNAMNDFIERDVPLPREFEKIGTEFVSIWSEIKVTYLTVYDGLDADLKVEGSRLHVFDDMGNSDKYTWEDAKTKTKGGYWPHFIDNSKATLTEINVSDIDAKQAISSRVLGLEGLEPNKFSSAEFVREAGVDNYLRNPGTVVRRYVHGMAQRYFQIIELGQFNHKLNGKYLKDIHDFVPKKDAKGRAIRGLREALIDASVEGGLKSTVNKTFEGNQLVKRCGNVCLEQLLADGIIEKVGGADDYRIVTNTDGTSPALEGFKVLRESGDVYLSELKNVLVNNFNPDKNLPRFIKQKKVGLRENYINDTAFKDMEDWINSTPSIVRLQDKLITPEDKTGRDGVDLLIREGLIEDLGDGTFSLPRGEKGTVPAIAEIINWQAFADQRLTRAKNGFVDAMGWNRVDELLSDSKRFFQGVNGLTTATLMGPFSTAFNLAEIGLLPGVTGSKRALQALTEYLTDKDGTTKEFAQRIGAASEDLSKYLADGSAIGEAALNAIQFTRVERVVRAVGAIAGWYSAMDAITVYMRVREAPGAAPRRIRATQRRLEQLNINAADIDRLLPQNGVTSADVETVSTRQKVAIIDGAASIVNPNRQTVVRLGNEARPNWEIEYGQILANSALQTSLFVFKEYDSRSLPRGLTDKHPIVKALFKFKAWPLQQTRMMYALHKEAAIQAVKGNPGPAGRLSQLYVAMGLGTTAAIMMRSYILGDDREGNLMTDWLTQHGLFGVAGDVVEMAVRSNGNPLLAKSNAQSFLGGPGISIGAEAFGDIVTGDVGGLGTSLARYIPVVGQVTPRFLPRPDSQGGGGTRTPQRAGRTSIRRSNR